MTEHLAPEKAFIVSVAIKPFGPTEFWKNGRLFDDTPRPMDSVNVYHLEEDPRGVPPEAFDFVLFHFPELALAELSTKHPTQGFNLLSDRKFTIDPVIGHLCRALLNEHIGEGRAERLLLDHVILAIHARVLSYDPLPHLTSLPPGGLSKEQLHRVMAMLTADLGADPALADIAAAVGVPASRLSAAFKISTGVPPFRWLRQHRVEVAKGLLRGSTLTLAEIAYACGFSDQSHFTRIFLSFTGFAPGAWRRRL
jgi:AraC-like DNA-binding protein